MKLYWSLDKSHSFAIVMIRLINTVARIKAEHLLYADWKPQTIAKEIRCCNDIVYKWNQRLQMYRIINLSHVQSIERLRRIIIVAKEWFLKFQTRRPWIYQNEFAIALEEEWDIMINQLIICRVLKINKINRKKR